MYTDRNTTNRLYRIWTEARRRCRNPRQDSYKERTITFDPVWDDYLIFMNWALCNGYSDELSIERIDNNLGYSHDNCRWATRSEQQYNQRKKQIKNSTSKYKGVSLDKRRGKWRARIVFNKKEKLLGYYPTEHEAGRARDKFVIDNNINTPLNFS